VTEPAVEVLEVAARPTAVMREQTTWPQLSATIQRLLDHVWTVMRTDSMGPRLSHDDFGENVILYLDRHPTIEVGVLVDRPISERDGLIPSELPAGRIARAIHRGPYDQLGRAHDGMHAWCRANGQTLTGVRWEHYGHWRDDPNELETLIAYVLRSGA
jgi:effector-binding domain-containing protein